MVAQRKKKYETGEGAQYISRRRAIRKLQLSLKDFRTLCVLKGIYPREPRNRKRAQKGETGIKTLYHTKDIHFLMHEPIIWQLRETKNLAKRVARAKAINDKELCRKTLDKYPKLKLDHIIKERYPTFIDAIRDVDDCLTLCFLFSTFPSLKHLPKDQSAMCRRLTIEFLHSVIEAKALRKVFVSIKGYYFQAEIKGELVTWIVPHHFSFEPQKAGEVDFKLMSTFVEFYIVLLGFINFRLYHSLNLYYPPKFPSLEEQSDQEKNLVDEGVFVAERVAALNFPLSKTSNSTEEEIPDLDTFTNEENPEKLEEIRKEAESIKTLKNLFKGLKFYLNREVPRESLVFIIRCFGGEVSWDKLLFVGATFGEDDETITHQIVDRPSMNKKYISRYYIQPQWIFDSVNARQLLPVNKYFMGAILPPHLSPFVDKDREHSYIPIEEKALYDAELLEKLHNDEENSEPEEEKDENDSEKESMDEDEENEGEDQEMDEDSEKPNAGTSKKMIVKPGQIEKEEPKEKTKQERQEYQLKEKMIKGKHRRLYKNMMNRRRDHGKEAWLLEKKRKMIDETKKMEKKEMKKTQKQEVKKTEKQEIKKTEKKKKGKASEK